MIVKTYKHGRRIICYIYEDKAGKYHTCTGKPSDSACISWIYETKAEAETTAQEYFNNYTNI